MIPRELLVLLAGALAFSAGLETRAAGQDGTRADGKAFGQSLLGRAQAAARTPPRADSIPHFGGDTPAAALFDDPDALAREAAAAAAGHDGYRTVRSSIDRRPRIDRADIDATVARANAVAAEPLPYVSGMGVEGGQGSCRPPPPATASAGFYTATCNSGTRIEQTDPQCTIPLRISVRHTTRYRYWCSSYDSQLNGVDDCASFAHAQCEVTGLHPGRCLQGTPDNCTEPGAPIKDLLCATAVPGATLRATEELVTLDERRDESACTTLQADPDCIVAAETCTASDPVTRTIDGVAVTRPCWAWTRDYRCTRRGETQDCGQLEGDPGCALVGETCLTDETPCPVRERVYRCPLPARPAPPQYICDGDIWCIGGECETIAREPNTEFRDAAVALNAVAQAGREFDPANLSLFKGERATCKKAVFGLLNCCAGKAFPLIPAGQLLVSLGCAREEILLHERDAQGLCAYVGSYCADSVLGVCVTKKKAYCRFGSKLSRILQEQGRPQLGLTWDKPRRESCRGFTVDEFARLDLSRMDFSEVYAEFQDAAKLPNELATVDAIQRRIADFYAQGQSR